MQAVPDSKWRIALFSLALTLTLGVGLAWVLARGAADPPRAPQVVLNENRFDRLVLAGASADARLYRLADVPAFEGLPFTIEVTAINEGEPRSAWGIWIGDARAADVLLLLVSDQGYVLSGLDSPTLQHHQFMHISAVENRLTLHAGEDSGLTFRVNDEVFRTLELSSGVPLDYGVALLGEAQLASFEFRVYEADER